MSYNARRRAGFKIALVVATLVCSGASAREAAAQNQPPPVTVGGECDSERYKALSETSFSTMGDVEFSYYMSLDSLCRHHKIGLAQSVAGSASAYNACAHPPYVRLLAKAPRDMTKREYDYFIARDRECAAFRKSSGMPPPPPPAPLPPRGPSAARQVLTGLAVLGSIIATLVASRD